MLETLSLVTDTSFTVGLFEVLILGGRIDNIVEARRMLVCHTELLLAGLDDLLQ